MEEDLNERERRVSRKHSLYTFESLNGFSHNFPEDVSMVLESPSGTTVTLMSQPGGATAINNVDLEITQGEIIALIDN